MKQRRYLVGLLAGLLVWAGQVTAGEIEQLFEQVAEAARVTSYRGTIVYHTNGATETSRIAHRWRDGREQERIESLDGLRRELVRINGELRCYLPDQKQVREGRHLASRSFPAPNQVDGHGADAFYELVALDNDRVAGLEARQYLLKPRDAFRYGHRLWLEGKTGLLLKSRLEGASGEALEQVSFTHIEIGHVTDEELRSRYAPQSKSWQRLDSPVVQGERPSRARLSSPVHGFREVLAQQRRWSEQGALVDHLLLSDGLVAVSVFVKPADGEAEDSASLVQGGLHVYRHRAKNHALTLVGEVPVALLQALATAVEVEKP